MQQRSSAHNILRPWSGELRINPIALSYFRPLRNGDGYNAVRWRDTDKRLARSRRHHPSVAFTPKRNTQAIRTVNRHCETGMFLSCILSAAVSCKEENAGSQRCDLNAGTASKSSIIVRQFSRIIV